LDSWKEENGEWRHSKKYGPYVEYILGKWNFKAAQSEKDKTKRNDLFSLAIAYFKRSVEHSTDTTFSIVAKLENEHICNAMWNLSVCYRYGFGTRKDDIESYKWAKQAAENGSHKAMDFLEIGTYGVIVDEFGNHLKGLQLIAWKDERGVFVLFKANDGKFENGNVPKGALLRFFIGSSQYETISVVASRNMYITAKKKHSTKQ